MYCRATPNVMTTPRSTRTGSRTCARRVRPHVMDAFRKHLGSPLVGVFGGVLFDEVALVPVAASVDRSGRFRENFTDRGIRSALSAISVFAGDRQQRADTAQWLKEQHRAVRGTGVGEYEGIRYSALDRAVDLDRGQRHQRHHGGLSPLHGLHADRNGERGRVSVPAVSTQGPGIAQRQR